MRRPAASAFLGCAAILVDFVGLGMIAPILPGVVSGQQIGNILSAQYLAVVLGQVLVGVLADHFGRRRLIMVVMLLDAFFFAATGFTTTYETILVLRLFAGLCAPVPLGISYVASVSRELSPAKAQWNFVFVGVSFNVGSLIGAATGGLLGPDLWLVANLASGAVPLVVAVWAAISDDTAEDAAKRRPFMRARAPQDAAPAAAEAMADDATAASADATAPAAALDAAPTAATVAPPATAAAMASTACDDVERPPKSGLRALLTTAEFAAVLLAFSTQGLFQGAFFSLMPVMIATLTANASHTPTNTSAASDDATVVNSSDDAPSLIAAVIIAAAALQIVANFTMIRPSVRTWGSIGHTSVVNFIGAALIASTATVVGMANAAHTESRTALVVVLCVLYPMAYVFSASSLTVLNQAAVKYAIKHGAPVGTVTGIVRSIFSALFGIAPAATIALYGVSSWLPLAIQVVLFFATAACFALMKAGRWLDPMPSEQRGPPGAASPQLATATEEVVVVTTGSSKGGAGRAG